MLRNKTAALFDHLVGAGEYCGRNFETECFSGFAVDNKFVLHGRLDPQVSGLFPFENAIHIGRCAPALVEESDP
jgi:hypothetical protein